MSKKPIIVFEGIEGSGKTLHINNLASHLKRKKIKFIKLREPGGNIGSEKIRKLILSNTSKFNKYTDLFLYMAARSENVENILKKNYNKKVILIDRFTDSTVAYQHYGMKINKKIIFLLNKFLLNKIKIDFTFLHLVSEKNLKKRLLLRKKLNRYDKFNLSFYKKVQKGFSKIAKLNKKRFLLIDSNNNVKSNKIVIEKKIDKILKI